MKRVNPCSLATSFQREGEEGDSDLLLPEFDDLVHSAELGVLSPRSVRSGKDSYFTESIEDAGLETFNAGPSETDELHALRETVKTLKQKESKMEAELLHFYDLEDQEHELLRLEEEMEEKTARIFKLEESLEERNLRLGKLQSQLKTIEEEKSVQNAKLKERIAALEARSTKLADEAASVAGLRKGLEEARGRNSEFQKQINTRAGNDKAELLMLKQKVATLEIEKEEGGKLDLETERKLQTLRELEVEVVELRRMTKDLQFQKRELTVKLDAAEHDVEYLQSRTEDDLFAEAEEDIASLRHVNEDLARQVEGLQNDRFTEVEELVYLRWVNACLRYELRNSKVVDGRFGAMDLNKNLSPRSQEKAKDLMLQYAGPDSIAMRSKDQVESGYESTSSETSNPSEDSSERSSEVGLASGHLSKKNSLIKRLKSWTGRKDDGGSASERSLSSRSDPGAKSRKKKTSRGPLEALLIRNTSDAVEITTYGAGNDEAQSPGTLTPTRSLSNLSLPGGQSALFRSNPNSPSFGSSLAPIRMSSSPGADGFNRIADSFQVIAKSVPPEISAKYPAFKDRHKAALEREQAIKEKARAEREKEKAEKEKAQVEKLPRGNWSEKIKQANLPQPFLESMPPLKRAEVISKPLTAAEVAKRELRKPNPPPKPARLQPSSAAAPPQLGGAAGGSPPPPPPPPPRGPGVPPPPPPPPMGGLLKMGVKNSDDVHRAPEVVEFYQSLMKRDAKNAVIASVGGSVPEARNNMIGEIENRSTHLLAVSVS